MNSNSQFPSHTSVGSMSLSDLVDNSYHFALASAEEEMKLESTIEKRPLGIFKIVREGTWILERQNRKLKEQLKKEKNKSASHWGKSELDKFNVHTEGADWKDVVMVPNMNQALELEFDRAKTELTGHAQDAAANELLSHDFKIYERLGKNPFYFFFARLQELCLRHAVEGLSEKSGQSTLAQEDKAEKATETAMHAFVETIKNGFNWDLVLMSEDKRMSYKLMDSTACHTLPVCYGSQHFNADNDGYLYIARPSKGMYKCTGELITDNSIGVRKTRYSKVPILTFEAKRRDHGKPAQAILAQQFCEMLSAVQANHFTIKKKLRNQPGHEVQESEFEEQTMFSVSMCHTELRIARATFSAKYQYEFYKGILEQGGDTHVPLLQTQPFDLRVPDQRSNAVEALLNLLILITSEAAQIIKVGQAWKIVRMANSNKEMILEDLNQEADVIVGAGTDESDDPTVFPQEEVGNTGILTELKSQMPIEDEQRLSQLSTEYQTGLKGDTY